MSGGSVWGTCEAAGRQTAECWFKWEWRIYTGHQLELRSGFPCEWESLRFLTAANLCWVCVCYWNIYIFSFIVKSFNSANREYFTNFAASVGAVMYLCTWVFPHVTLWERMCEITTRNLFKKTSQVSHEAQKHHCALFFWITKVENQFSFSLSIKKYVCPSAAGFNLIIIITIMMMALVMIRWGSANTISLICVCCDADEARSVWMQVEAAGRNKPFQNQISS